jgi:hypothetical protein
MLICSVIVAHQVGRPQCPGEGFCDLSCPPLSCRMPCHLEPRWLPAGRGPEQGTRTSAQRSASGPRTGQSPRSPQRASSRFAVDHLRISRQSGVRAADSSSARLALFLSATPTQHGGGKSLAINDSAVLGSGARKASEIVRLTLRTLRCSNPSIADMVCKPTHDAKANREFAPSDKQAQANKNTSAGSPIASTVFSEIP